MNTKRWTSIAVFVLFCLWQPAMAQSLVLVPSQGTLQQAINQVADGGVIEIAAGEYAAPAGGFQIVNAGKSFTIRAATNATVALNGSGSTDILRITNASAAAARPIIIERIIFRSGFSNVGNIGGAASLIFAKTTFSDCRFENNIASPTASGGGGAIQAGVSDLTIVNTTFSGNSARVSASGGAIRVSDSRLLLLDSTFTGNDAWESAGALSLFRSRAYVHGTRFENNRVNLPNHYVNSLGGAISSADSQLRVSNSRFSANQAGFSGGAIYTYGYWDGEGMDVIVSNSTFIDNSVKRDPTRPSGGSTYAGAIQVEDFVNMRVYGSRFITNSAESGGAIESFRANVEIYDSAFLGNFAIGTHVEANMAGAIHSTSQDGPQETANHPNARLLIRNSLFQGRYGSVTNAARTGGCLLVAGDPVRAYGLSGSPVMGTVASNRAVLDVANSVFSDCDVQENQGGGYGGGMMLSLTDATIRDTLFIGNDARAGATNTGGGGAIFMYDNTKALIQRATFVKSTAGFQGGAISMQGSDLRVEDSQFAENSLNGASRWGGAAIFAGPENLGAPRQPVNGTGLVQNSVFSNNSGGGVAVLDVDYPNTPYNLMQYSANRIFPNDANFYSNGLTGAQTIAQMNALSLHGQAKSPTANIGLASAPIVAAMQPAPSRVLPTYAVGDTAQPTPAYVSYAWSGASASLDGSAVNGNFGTTAVAPGAHTLSVASTNVTATITQAAGPATQLAARPRKIGANGTSRLYWNLLAGTFVEQFIDQAVNLTPPGTASGNQLVVPNGRLTYRGLLLTTEGGTVAAAATDYVPDRLFADGLD